MKARSKEKWRQAGSLSYGFNNAHPSPLRYDSTGNANNAGRAGLKG